MAVSSDNDHEPSGWTVESSTHVFKDRWISVRADSCRTPDGVEIAPFYVLECADWVQVVALDDQDHVVLVEQYRHGLGIEALELPSGGVEPEDANPVEAARRDCVSQSSRCPTLSTNSPCLRITERSMSSKAAGGSCLRRNISSIFATF